MALYIYAGIKMTDRWGPFYVIRMYIYSRETVMVKNFLHLYLVFLLIWKTAMDSFNGFSKICHIACMVNTSWSGQTLFGSSIVTSNKHYVCIVLEIFLSFLLKKSSNAENIKSPVSTRDRERRNSLCKHVFLNAWNLQYIDR